MDAINKIVNLEQKTDKQEQCSRWNCVLVYGFPENNAENSDDVVISTIFEHLIILIFEQDIDRSHRVAKFDLGKIQPRPAIAKFICNNVLHKVLVNKLKLKEKEFESLTKLRLVRLNEAREQHSFGNVSFYDKKTRYKDSNNKVNIFYEIRIFK